MNLSQLRYFMEISRTGSYSTAAQRLGVTRQALSRYVEGLEEAIGKPLFSKKDGQLIPTATGEKYLRTASEIYEVMVRTRASIRSLSKTDSRASRFGVTLRHGSILLNECIADLFSRYPNFHPELTAGLSRDLVSEVYSGDLDVAMISRSGLDPESTLQSYNLCESELFLCVPEYHALAHDIHEFDKLPLVDIETLKDEVFILSKRTGGLMNPVEQIFRDATYTPTVSAWADLVDTVLTLVQKGFGVAFLPYYEHPGVCYLRIKNAVPSSIAVIFRQGYELSEPDRYLVWLLKQRLLSSHMVLPSENDFVRGLDEEFAE